MEKMLQNILALFASLLEAFSPKSELLKKWHAYQRRKDIKDVVKMLVLEITLATDKTEYDIPQYQRLNDTRLVDVCIANSQYLTKSSTNKTIASIQAHANGFLNLQNKRSENIVEKIPGFYFMMELLSTVAFFPVGRSKFNMIDIDWTKSKWIYADNTLPNANTGTSVLIVVKYIDLVPPEGYVEP
jgi:hypothetical protein